jgi:hypothetical protein
VKNGFRYCASSFKSTVTMILASQTQGVAYTTTVHTCSLRRTVPKTGQLTIRGTVLLLSPTESSHNSNTYILYSRWFSLLSHYSWYNIVTKQETADGGKSFDTTVALAQAPTTVTMIHSLLALLAASSKGGSFYFVADKRLLDCAIFLW